MGFRYSTSLGTQYLLVRLLMNYDSHEIAFDDTEARSSRSLPIV